MNANKKGHDVKNFLDIRPVSTVVSPFNWQLQHSVGLKLHGKHVVKQSTYKVVEQ